MGFGFLARLYKGSRVVFQRRQVSDGVWLPSEFRYSGGGRVLLLKKLRVEGIREYSDYQAANEGQPSPARSIAGFGLASPVLTASAAHPGR